MEFDDDDATSEGSGSRRPPSSRTKASEARSTRSSIRGKGRSLSPVPLRLSATKEDDESTDQDIDPADFQEDGGDFESLFTFKVKDSNGNLHKISCSAEHYGKLVKAVCERLKCDESQALELKYKDSDGDDLLISDDQSLNEAVDNARASGNDTLRITIGTIAAPAADTVNATVAPSAPAPNAAAPNHTAVGSETGGDVVKQGMDPTTRNMAIAGGAGAVILLLTVLMMRRKAS